MNPEVPKKKIAVVIPYYNAANHIVNVIEKLPDAVDKVIVVDDKSLQPLPKEQLSTSSFASKLVLLENMENMGVGGASKRGFEEAIRLQTDYVIKVDADDQMDTSYIPQLVVALDREQCEMAKGNRFRDFSALKRMPVVRRMGNLGLSFLTKMATGYWHNFDPTNGFFAIRTDVLKNIELSKVANRYFFETSLLSQLYYQNARIKDIPMPAIYGDEKSAMQVWKMPFVFFPELVGILVKRIIKTYFIYDFNITSLHLLFGVPLFLFGVIYGSYSWWYHTSHDVLAPTGTIMIITLSIILGFQLLLQAIQYDIFRTPKAS